MSTEAVGLQAVKIAVGDHAPQRGVAGLVSFDACAVNRTNQDTTSSRSTNVFGSEAEEQNTHSCL